jgi:hypothetical protein
MDKPNHRLVRKNPDKAVIPGAEGINCAFRQKK